MLEFMSCARPVILGVEGQAQQIIQDSGAGITIQPESAEALSAAIHQLAADRELANRLGQKGREYILQHCSRDRTAQKYIEVLDTIVKNAEAEEPA